MNLASAMLYDAFNRDFDLAAVITNDSDLKGPIGIVRSPPFGLPVHVFNPSPGMRTKMGASAHVDLTAADYAACLLPDPITLADDTVLTMPTEWRMQEEGPPAGDPIPG